MDVNANWKGRLLPTVTAFAVAAAVAWASPAQAKKKCSPDSVQVGPVCVDKYEASVWTIPVTNKTLIKKVQRGRVTLADLLSGATLRQPADNIGVNVLNYTTGLPVDGNWTPISGTDPPTPGVYAVSVPGEYPSAGLSWFQAAQACAFSGKRLLTNQEWQIAAAGTPDPDIDDGATDCNILGSVEGGTGTGPSRTGARSKCVSSWGVFDMVGNLDEWVADWDERTTGGGVYIRFCSTDSPPSSVGIPCTTDANCSGGTCSMGDYARIGSSTTVTGEPAAYQRGGNYGWGTNSGIFAVGAGGTVQLWATHPYFGFRCAR